MEIDRKILKKLWNGESVICPNCGKDYLLPLHKNKSDNNDFRCSSCEKVYITISIFNNMLKEGK